MTADDELHTGQAVLQKNRMEFEAVTTVNLDEITTDLLTHDRVITVTRDVDQHSCEAAKAIKARNSTHTRTLTQCQDQFGIGRQAFRIDLEKLIAWILFKHIDKCLARMVFAVKAEMLDNCVGFGANERNTRDRARVGNGGEQSDETKFADGFTFRTKNLHADIIKIRPAMDQRKRICLGHDQRFIAVEEVSDFAWCHRVVVILAEDTHFAVVQDTQCFLDRNQFAVVTLALEGQLTHAEEDETIIAQPFEKGDCFRHCGITRQFLNPLVIGDSAIKALHHRLPVADSGTDLSEHTLDRGGQISFRLLVECWQMNLHKAYALNALGGCELRCFA